MLLNVRELAEGQVLQCDLCVIGAGAAGITLALRLARTGRSVVLLEAGGDVYDQATQKLYTGRESGTLIKPDSFYLAASRTRYFGGSTNHWNGWCRPMDPETFLSRPWVHPDGWLLKRSELDPYYDQAAGFAEISPFNYKERWLDQPNKRFLFNPAADFETTFFHLSPPTRFGPRYRGDLERARDVRVVLDANVTQIEVDADARHVVGLEVKSLAGRSVRVQARGYVLAAGGIENARLLLASNRTQAEGLGNGRDLVGRYFMDHPVIRAGFLVATSPQRSVDRYTAFTIGRREHKARGVLRPTWEVQQRERLPNSLVVLDPVAPANLPELAREISLLSLDMTRLEIGSEAIARRRVEFMGVRVVVEPIPDPESRATLTDELDALGVPRLHLHWSLSDDDARNLRTVARLLARELSWRMRGRMSLMTTDDEPWLRAGWSNHHAGTTRMHADPGRGVVDPDSRVHGVDNLWIAGGSVFPVAGVSNPTLTILALTLRLADHLEERLA